MPKQPDKGPGTGMIEGIWWQAHGSGEPLLLIQGLGYSSDMWHRLLPQLVPWYRVLVFDNRGIGRSAGAVDGLTIEQMAADAATVIAAAGEESAHVFGVSLGGIVAQELALSHAEKVRDLVLGCTHTCDGHVVLAEHEVLSMLASRASLDGEAALRASVPFVYAPTTPEEVIEADLVRRRIHPPSLAAYMAQVGASSAFHGTWVRLRELESPTLVLHGVDDELVPPANALVISNRIPKAKVQLLENVSHCFYSEEPVKTAAIIRDFLGQRSTAK